MGKLYRQESFYILKLKYVIKKLEHNNFYFLYHPCARRRRVRTFHLVCHKYYEGYSSIRIIVCCNCGRGSKFFSILVPSLFFLLILHNTIQPKRVREKNQQNIYLFQDLLRRWVSLRSFFCLALLSVF